MANRKLHYKPNPAHKITTTEVGPPRWRPDKTACPEDITWEEREELVRISVSENCDPFGPVRYAVRRKDGKLQWFRTLLTCEHSDGQIEIHGHPFEPGFPKVPPNVLKQLRDNGLITMAEYRQAVKS